METVLRIGPYRIVTFDEYSQFAEIENCDRTLGTYLRSAPYHRATPVGVSLIGWNPTPFEVNTGWRG